jgi:hypothetical protein
VVLELLRAQLLNKGYHLYQDDYYNRVELSDILLEKTHTSAIHCASIEEFQEMKEKIKILEERRVHLLS